MESKSSADILPFGQPKDYAEGVRFVRPSHIAQANREAPDLIEQLRRREAEAERSPINWFNLAAAVLVWTVMIVCTAYAVSLWVKPQ